MKKSLLVLCFMAATLMADRFIGLDLGYGKYTASTEDDRSTVGSSDSDYSQTPFTLKLGMGKADNLSMDIYYKSITQKFDDNDVSSFEFGYKLRKAFDIHQGDLHPFVQGGLMVGSTETDFLISGSNGSVDNSWSFYGLKAGGGVNFIVGDNIELLAGLDIQKNFYQPLSYSSFSTSSSLNRDDFGFELYIGVNFWLGSARSHDASYDDHADSLY